VNTVNGGNLLSCGHPNVFRSGSVVAAGTTTPVQTLILNPSGTSFSLNAAPGWLTLSDGDRGNSTNFGFYHQELTAPGGGVTDITVSDRFRLPRGAVCGFHHSQNTAYNPPAGRQSTCMGQDPAIGDCPHGWAAKNHFDMSSGDGTASCTNLNGEAGGHCGYFAWCEYQDPNGYCDDDPSCTANARAAGYGFGVSSSTDPSGFESYGGGSAASPPCPAGFSRTNFYDDGRLAGQGLSWCVPIPDLPQGLVAGLAYVALPQVTGGVAYEAVTPFSNGDGFAIVNDGDRGAPSGVGFYHQELVSGGVTDPSVSASFKLLPGTICGFHHTLQTPGTTCMGFHPDQACPSGWTSRRHFDSNSGTGYYVWCEYQDPQQRCAYPEQTNCESEALDIGYATSISSNTDSTGVALATGGACPTGWVRTPYFDAGRPSGQGLSFCKP
jgi:hypothetical protein